MMLPNHPHDRPLISQPLIKDPNHPISKPSDKDVSSEMIRRDRRAVRPSLRREIVDWAFDARVPGSDEARITANEEVARTLFPRGDDAASAGSRVFFDEAAEGGRQECAAGLVVFSEDVDVAIG
jgi:hypothetical protein